MNHYPTSLASHQQGAVLLESLIAILIFSFGVLALAGLQAAMIKNTDDAKYRAEAAFIAQEKISEIWTGGRSLEDYATKDDEDVPRLPSGKLSVAVANREVSVTVTWTAPGGSEHNYLANTRIEGLI